MPKFTESDIVKLQQRGLKVNDPVIEKKLNDAFGLPKKQKRNYSGKEKNHIEAVLIALKLDYKKEYRFNDKRKFKFDFCLPTQKIGIEYEGLHSDKSRHTQINGYSNDVIKYNLALIDGWRVLRYTANNYMNILTDLETLLK